MATSVWFPRPRAVELRREPLADLGSGDVRVRAIASAISHGTEMLVFRGQVAPDLSLDLPTLAGGFGFPIKYGYACVGRVVEAGRDVDSLRPDDLVFVHHPHQDELIVPASLPIRLPDNLLPELGVFFANVETAVNVALDAHPRLGERVVVFGQGVVGLLATQVLRRAGAGVIVTVDPVPLRRELARTVGADHALDPGDGLVGAIESLTAGIGADLIVEASGNGVALGQAIDCAAFQGTIVVCSWYGVKPVSLQLGGAFHRRRLRLVSSQVSNIDPGLTPRWTVARRQGLARDLLGRLTLEPLITHRLPLANAAAAYDLVDRRPDEVVQVLLTYGGDDV